MSRGLEVEIKVIEKEFLKFKAEYERLEKQVRSKGLNISLNDSELRNFNYNITDISQTLISISTITNSLKPISEFLGIKDLRPLTNGIVGVANGLNMVRTASTAVGVSLGWISIATTALSFFISLLNDAQKETDKVKESEEDLVELYRKKYKLEEELQKVQNSRLANKQAGLIAIRDLDKQILDLENEIEIVRENSIADLKAGSSKKDDKKSGGISEASQVYDNFATIFKDLKTQLDVGLITFEEFNSTSSEKMLELQALVSENFNMLSEENKKYVEKALSAGEKNLANVDTILSDATKKAVEFAEKMISSFNALGDGIINSLDSFVEGDLEGGMLELTDGIMSAGFGIAGDIAKGIAGPIGEVGVKAVQAVWDFFVSLFMWWRANEKKTREAEEKRKKEEFEKKKQADMEALKEKREAEKEALKREKKARQENIKKLEKDLDIFESAFSRGAIGLGQYIAEIERNLKKKQEEQEAIDNAERTDKEKDKQHKKDFEKVKNRQYGAPTPQMAPQNASSYNVPQNASSSYTSSITNSSNSVKIENIHINAIIDPSNKNSLKELSMQILEEFKKLKIQGGFEGV